MTLNIQIPESSDLRPKIIVFGVGGAGCNAVNNMIDKELEGVEFLVANTDAQALAQSKAKKSIQLGEKLTQGLGAGACPIQGAKAAEENIETIVDHLQGAHMCFITAGMGGGTGTGAAPVVARVAREMDILTVGVVTKPFQFEGAKRMRQAEEGIIELQKVVHTLIIIPNQNLFSIATEKTTFSQAFSMADEVLHQGVKGITDLMVCTGLINLDFADIRSVMNEMGKAMMGTGEAEGENRAIIAAEQAISNPLLDQISLNTAKGVLINISGGDDLTLFEADEAANLIRDKMDSDANVIVGSIKDETLNGKMRVSVVATGIDAIEGLSERDVFPRVLKTPIKADEGADTGLNTDLETGYVAEQVEDPFETRPADNANSDIPEPAYQPNTEGAETRQMFAEDGAGASAPSGAPSGVPSGVPSVNPDVRARLEAAVMKQPTPARDNMGNGYDDIAMGNGVAGERQSPPPRTFERPQMDTRADTRPRHEPPQPRGIFSLFARKKPAGHETRAPQGHQGNQGNQGQGGHQNHQGNQGGHPQDNPRDYGFEQGRDTSGGGAPSQPPAHVSANERPSPVSGAGGRGDAAYMDSREEQDRIEIPAFLRRQAN